MGCGASNGAKEKKAASFEPTAKAPEFYDFYTLEKELGRGSFSVVYAGTRLDDSHDVAVKVIDKNAVNFNESLLDTEVKILLSVKHDNVIRLFEVYDGKDFYYMVLERVNGGELFDHIVSRGHYAEHDAAVITRQIIDALVYLHGLHIVHRDLKPENLLVETSGSGDTVLKIADFGLSKVITQDTILQTACGTPGYVAPEILTAQQRHRSYSESVDLWSVGVILYILLCGFPPFYHEDTRTLFSIIKLGKYNYPSPQWDDVSDKAKDMINKLLVVKPENRMDAKQALQHEWLVGENSKANLAHARAEMARWNAKRKLKGAIHTVIIGVRMEKASRSSPSVREDVDA